MRPIISDRLPALLSNTRHASVLLRKLKHYHFKNSRMLFLESGAAFLKEIRNSHSHMTLTLQIVWSRRHVIVEVKVKIKDKRVGSMLRVKEI